MTGSVARLPHGHNGDDGVPPADIYKAAIDEYRFQVQFNWTRTQYMLAFNAAILAAATAVASRPGRGAALVFALGAFAALLSVLVIRTQHDYYRAARNRVRRIEADLHVPEDQRTDTTATMGERRRRGASVTQYVYLLLVAVAVADMVGIGIIASR